MADTCTSCGFGGVQSDRCPQCGSPVRSPFEAMRRGPVRAAPAAPARRADIASAPASSGAPAAAVAATAVTAPAGGVRPTPSSRPGGAVHSLRFHGAGGTLFGIHVVNVLLTLVTLGVYRFWAKTRVRRYVMSQTELDGDRFAWHGTGKELLVGFAKAMIVFFLPIMALNAVATLQPDGLLAGVAKLLASVVAVIFVPIAMVGVHRYRLTRTSWRGIRFSFHGRVGDYVKRFIADSILVGVSFGFYYPSFQVNRHAFMVSNARFGQRAFAFEGRGRDLMRPFLVAVVLTLPTIGLSWFWYAAARRRYFAGRTTFGAARFRSTATGRELMNLGLGNALLLILSLGIAWPWVRVRTTRFNYGCLRIDGVLDLDTIVQQRQDAPATGDALSSLLGADIDFA